MDEGPQKYAIIVKGDSLDEVVEETAHLYYMVLTRMLRAQRPFAPKVIGRVWNPDRHQIGMGDRLRWNTQSDSRFIIARPSYTVHTGA